MFLIQKHIDIFGFILRGSDFTWILNIVGRNWTRNLKNKYLLNDFIIIGFLWSWNEDEIDGELAGETYNFFYRYDLQMKPESSSRILFEKVSRSTWMVGCVCVILVICISDTYSHVESLCSSGICENMCMRCVFVCCTHVGFSHNSNIRNQMKCLEVKLVVNFDTNTWVLIADTLTHSIPIWYIQCVFSLLFPIYESFHLFGSCLRLYVA